MTMGASCHSRREAARRGPVNIPKLLLPGNYYQSIMALCLVLAGVLPAFGQAPSIFLGTDPGAGPACHCLDNATTLLDGQFQDTITITSDPDESWTVVTATGAFAETSPAPPSAPQPVLVATPLTQISPGVYQLVIRHVDADGFTLIATNGVDMPLQIGNTCYYPNPQFVGLPDTVCLTGLPVPLQANAGGAAGVGNFFIDDVPATVFNAQVLGVGDYEVSYRFDAGDATPGDSNDPGCVTTIRKIVTVPPQPSTAVNALINITLGPDCTTLITPDMVMEGTYPCEDDFVVTVYDQFGNPIGNTVTGAQAGFTLDVLVMSMAGGYIGEGQIMIFDVDAPEIFCPPSTNLADVANEVQFLNSAVTNTSPTFIPNNFACYNPAVEPLSGLHFYKLDTIFVTETDVYTFELDMNTPGGGAFGIYHNAFSTFGGPCQNLAGVGEPLPADEGYFVNQPNIKRLQLMMMPGMPYIILTTAFQGNQIGNFQYAIYSEGTGSVVGLGGTPATVSLPLYCSSVGQLANNPTSLAILGEPTIVDNCMLNPTVTFSDAVNNPGVCGVATITRTFTVTDESNNSSSCVQTIEFPVIELEDVNYPPQTVVLSCGETFVTTDQGNPSPTVTGYPFVVTAQGTFDIAPVYCNMLATFTDLPTVFVCDGTTQFVRQWVIFDDCNSNNLVEFDQVIVVGDMSPPVVSCSAPDNDFDGLPDTLVYSTGGGSCTATLTAPLPNVSDDCSGWVVTTELVTDQQVPITNPFGVVIGFNTQTIVLATIPPGGDRVLTNVPTGNHRFRYIVTDDCANTTQIECPIRVVDLSLPTAVCDDLINVALGGNGSGVIMAADIDEGSSDNCGPVTLQIRRTIDFDPADCLPELPVTTPWAPSVDVFCCEVGDTITVELLVTDTGGNVNTCSTDVAVLDNTPPTCVPPQPVFTTCADLPADFLADDPDVSELADLFGMATFQDACLGASIQELSPTINMADCGQGSIIRRFQASDAAGNVSSCQQLITISGNTNYEIKFPKDVFGDCVDPGADTVMINNFGCDPMAINSSDQVFDVTDGACFKILRTYTVINWCEYNGYSPAIEVPRNPECGSTGGLNDVWVLRRPNGAAYIDADNDETNLIPSSGIRGINCDGLSNPNGFWLNSPTNGYWSYTQVIKVLDSTAPQITAVAPEPFCSLDGNNCDGDVSILFSISDDCASDDPTVSIAVDLNNTGLFNVPGLLSGTYPNYTATGTYPIGNHRLRIQVEDACGNTNEEIVDFAVVDCTAPGLICNSSITVGLMEQLPNVDADGDGDIDLAAVAVNVNLFVNSTGEDCTGPLRFTLHKLTDIMSGMDVPFPNHPALVVTCDDIGTVPVRIYAWDSAFNPYAVQPDGTVGGPNYATCDALLTVQDNQFLCAGGLGGGIGNVSGLILTEEGEPVAGVEVAPAVDLMDEMMMTEDDGLYQFDLETENDYLIQPYSQEDYLNGVTTLDVVLIAKHVLGVQMLDSPYRIIAADINKSNSVTTLDLVHLRKLILGISNDFPNNTSWRFVNAAFDFPVPENPWLEPFPEAYTIPSLAGDIAGADFIAVKIGDVNGNATANMFSDTEERYLGDTYYLRTDERSFTAGETVEAVFNAADEDDQVTGFQFTLQFDPSLLAWEEIEWGQVQPEHVNTSMADQGMIRVSWNPRDEEELATQSEYSYFSLRFTAQREGRLSDAVAITSRLTNAEAYSLNYEVRGLGLNFAPASAAGEAFFLEQNRPNPFGDQTIIGFQIPQSGSVSLTIFDTNGKVVQRYQQYYTAGYNQILVDAQEIAARGLLYYQLETEGYAATKKMVILTE